MINVRKLKARIYEAGLTQAMMAKKIGMNESSLNKKVNDASGKNLSIEEVEKISNVLAIPPEERDLYFFV